MAPSFVLLSRECEASAHKYGPTTRPALLKTMDGMTKAPSLDLRRYFASIGHTGDAAPARAVLDKFIAGHTCTIPSENLDPLLGTPNRLDLATLQRKLVDGGRGGYCLGQNLLLRLGFAVRALSVRVRWQVTPDAVTPRSYMLLLVPVGGEQRIADVVFDGLGLTTSLAFDSDFARPAPLEPFRLVRADGEHTPQAQLGETWHPLYRFDLQAQLPVDYDASNWYMSTSASVLRESWMRNSSPSSVHAGHGKKISPWPWFASGDPTGFTSRGGPESVGSFACSLGPSQLTRRGSAAVAASEVPPTHLP